MNDLEQIKAALQDADGFKQFDTEDLAWPDQEQDDLAVLKIVTQDYARAESYLVSRNYPVEWSTAERLFNFQVDGAMWEGTNVPRSSLSIPLVCEHIESILPQ